MTRPDAPPRWDLTPIYGGLDDREFTAALEGVYAGIDRLAALYDELDIHATEPRQPCDDDVARFSPDLAGLGLCERRRRTSLSVADLNGAMLDAQQAAYGDGLHPEHRHPYMWAVKPHYFTPFYNWPYTFGLLFGIGLYARYLDDPDRFRAGYDDLLSMVGMADAATLAGRFGFDVREGAFWAESLAVLGRHIDDYEQLARDLV